MNRKLKSKINKYFCDIIKVFPVNFVKMFLKTEISNKNLSATSRTLFKE